MFIVNVIVFMGVRHLNRYLQNTCSGIHTISLHDLSHQKIVVDVSIYLYKYKAVDKLLPNMEQLMRVFISLSIQPIFVFDGKPKQIKLQALRARQERKNVAWQQYQEMSKTVPLSSLQHLKTQFTKVSRNDIDQVKKIMDSLGAVYIDAPHEADEVCAKLMLTNQVYACISDDMDMLIHGCARVVRNIELNTQTATLYKLDNILHSLHMNYTEFKQVCVISGTDYYESNHTLFKYIKLYKQFKRTNYNDFYDWLDRIGALSNRNELMRSFKMFNVLEFDYLNHITLPLPQQPLQLLQSLQSLQSLTSQNVCSCIAAN